MEQFCLMQRLSEWKTKSKCELENELLIKRKTLLENKTLKKTSEDDKLERNNE